MTPFEIIYLVGLGLYLLFIYIPGVSRYRRIRKTRMQTRPLDALFDTLTWLGWQVLPLISIFTHWLRFADFSLPAWCGWLGAGFLAAALLLMSLAYADLGLSWSPKIEINEHHNLVTTGIYRWMRHPIYAAMWLWAFANIFLLQNVLAGFTMLAFFIPLYIIRVPCEERLMLDTFGEDYQTYMARTGRIFPRF